MIKQSKKTHSKPIKRISIETKNWYIRKETNKATEKVLRKGNYTRKRLIKKLRKPIWKETKKEHYKGN